MINIFCLEVIKVKRMLCFILCLSAAVACGNNKASDAAELEKRAFSSKAEVIWRDKSYRGEIVRKDAKSLMLVLSGENFAVPLCYEISQGGYKSTQGELELTIPFDDAQPQAIAVEIYRAMSLLGRSEVTDKGDVTVYKTPLAVLRYDEKNDVFISLETGNGKITFSDFSFGEKEY